MTNKFMPIPFYKTLEFNDHINNFLTYINYESKHNLILLKANSINQWNKFYTELSQNALNNEYFNKIFFKEEIENTNKAYDLQNSIFIKDKETHKIIGTFKYNLEQYIDKSFISAGIAFNFAYITPTYRGNGISKVIRAIIQNDIQNNIPKFIDQCNTWIDKNGIIPADISLEMHCVSNEGQILNQQIVIDINDILNKQDLKYVKFKDNTIPYKVNKKCYNITYGSNE